MTPSKNLRGHVLLHNARFNKGSAFTQAERDALGLNGLIPDQIDDVQVQMVCTPTVGEACQKFDHFYRGDCTKELQHGRP